MQDREIKGITTELLCQIELTKRNINVSIPVSPYCKYDLIAEIDGTLYKIQVKYANKNQAGIFINAHSTHLSSNGSVVSTYSEKDIDFFFTYYDSNCYLIPIGEVIGRKQITLVLNEGSNKNKYFLCANDFLLDTQLENIKAGFSNQKKYIIQKMAMNSMVVGEHESIMDCALSCGDKSKRSHICDCINGKRESAYGYKWKRICRAGSNE